mgnify:CR=1 FL=1
MKKIGIITFHNSYNCGSMLESYAIEEYLKQQGLNVEIINFSNSGQRQLYSIFNKNNSLKNIVKNILLLPARKRILINNNNYEKFRNDYFNLSNEYSDISQLNDDDYSIIVAGSDQIWNPDITGGFQAEFFGQSKLIKGKTNVAYAASCGDVSALSEAQTNDLIEYTSKLD